MNSHRLTSVALGNTQTNTVHAQVQKLYMGESPRRRSTMETCRRDAYRWSQKGGDMRETPAKVRVVVVVGGDVSLRENARVRW